MEAKIIVMSGGIGAGKSYVMHHVAKHPQVAVIDSDTVAKELMEPGQTGFERTVELLGQDVVGEDGRLDTVAVSRRIFADGDLRLKLNAVIHPLVKEEVRRRAEASGCPVVFVETAIAIESGFDDLGELWYVDAPEDVRLRRLVTERKMAPERARAVMDAQLSARVYRERADVIIENGDGDRPEETVDRELKRLLGENPGEKEADHGVKAVVGAAAGACIARETERTDGE